MCERIAADGLDTVSRVAGKHYETKDDGDKDDEASYGKAKGSEGVLDGSNAAEAKVFHDTSGKGIIGSGKEEAGGDDDFDEVFDTAGSGGLGGANDIAAFDCFHAYTLGRRAGDGVAFFDGAVFLIDTDKGETSGNN